MARIIEFQIPQNYRRKAQVIITTTRGKVTEFATVFKKPEPLIGVRRPGITQQSDRSLILVGRRLSASRTAGIL